MGAPSISEIVQLQMRIAVKHGGAGIVATQQLTHAAYLGSWSNCKQRVQTELEGLRGGEVGRTLDDVSQLHDQLSCHAAIHAAHHYLLPLSAGAKEPLPPPNAIDGAPRKAQRAFSQYIHRQNRLDLMVLCPAKEDQARLLSVGGFMASAWLQAFPGILPLEMTNSEFKIALRLRLGLTQIHIQPGTICRCKKSADRLGLHHLTCKHGNYRSVRHDRVADVIAAMLKALGFKSSTSSLSSLLPVIPTAKYPHVVPDVYGAATASRPYGICADISVTHPAAASYVSAAADTRLSAAKKREELKREKYGAHASKAGLYFLAVVFEVYGAAGADFEKWFKETWKEVDRQDQPAMEEQEQDANMWLARTKSSFWQQRISVALQKCNAKLIELASARDGPSGG